MVGHRPPLENSLSCPHPVADAPNRSDEAGRCRVISQLATKMTYMYIDEVVIADPRLVANCLKKLTSAEDYSGSRG